VAVSLVPFNSVAAVPRKSAGATLAQVAIVTGGTSGEESRAARPSVSASTIPPAIDAIGMSTMCHISIWPKFITLKNAPTPTELNASLPLVEIHWESKFGCDR